MQTARGPATRLEDLQLAPIVVVKPDATIVDVARAMMRTAVSAVIVGTGAAIITQRDLVAALARGRPTSDEAMTVATMQPLTIRTSHTALDAMAAMVRNEVHHLVVLDEVGDPVGVARLSDMAEIVLGESAVPHWLTAFRLALRSETILQTLSPDPDPPAR
ncbi:MAG: CBS domain-containing protein [Acidimicrobiia bacterium]